MAGTERADGTQELDDTAGEPAAPPRPRRRSVLATVLAVLVVVAGFFVYFNTDIGTPDRICHGWVSSDEASAVLGGGPGRVTTRETNPDSCVIEKSGWLRGGGTLDLERKWEVDAFPFATGWEVSGHQHVLSGGTHGAYGARDGWVALSPECDGHPPADTAQRVIHAYVTEGGTADLGRLLTSVGSRLSGGDCARSEKSVPATHDTGPSGDHALDPEKVCGLEGFRLKGLRGPGGRPVQESVTGDARRGLYCDLTVKGDKQPFARVAIVNDPVFILKPKDDGFTRTRCDGKETLLAWDVRHFDDQTPAPSRFPGSAAFGKEFTEAARKAAHCG